MALQNARLPQDILETVIDEAAGSTDSTEKEVKETLCACSLVCYAFRHRVYRHLFSTLQLWQHLFCSRSRLLRRLSDLRELVHACHVLGMASLLYFTRSFKLVMEGGSACDAYAILQNEDLTKIMHALCKYSPAIRTVTLAGSKLIPIFWPHLSRDFQEAFMELIRVRTVRTLCLDNISGVPDIILREINIRHIRFHMVKLFSPIEPFCGLSQTDQLADIDIDYTFPFPLPPPSSSSTDPNTDDDESFPVPPSQPGLCLSNLRSLKYTSYHPEHFHRFTNIALSFRSLEKIHIVFPDSTSMYSQEFSDALQLPLPPIPFGSLPRLRTLGICHRSSITVGMGVDMDSWSPLMKVLDLLECGMSDSVLPLPPALETLVLGFVVHTHPPWIRVDEFFPERKMWGILDRRLSLEFDTPETTQSESERRRLGDRDWQQHHLPWHRENGHGNVKPVTVKLRLQYITLRGEPWAFNERAFGERCRSYLGDVFPRLMGCGAGGGEKDGIGESDTELGGVKCNERDEDRESKSKRGAKLEVDVSVFPLGRNVDILGWDV